MLELKVLVKSFAKKKKSLGVVCSQDNFSKYRYLNRRSYSCCTIKLLEVHKSWYNQIQNIENKPKYDKLRKIKKIVGLFYLSP